MQKLELFLLPEEAANEQIVNQKLAQKGFSDQQHNFRLVKRPIDARSKQAKILLQYEVFKKAEVIPDNIIERNYQYVTNSKPVVIIGCGPAGLFAALRLIEL